MSPGSSPPTRSSVRRFTTTRLAAVVAATLVLGGCGADALTSADGPSSSSAPTVAVETTAAAATTTTTSSTTTTEAPADLAEPLFAGLEHQIRLLSPLSGTGRRPLLEWESVPGADHYAVFLYAPNGEVYWAWSGASESVHVGGEPQLGANVPGPSASAGMSWAVIAYDTDLLPIAVSEQRPIAP